jgi:Zn-dependent peptidase ImmA (M78 family)
MEKIKIFFCVKSKIELDRDVSSAAVETLLEPKEELHKALLEVSFQTNVSILKVKSYFGVLLIVFVVTILQFIIVTRCSRL